MRMAGKSAMRNASRAPKSIRFIFPADPAEKIRGAVMSVLKHFKKVQARVGPKESRWATISIRPEDMAQRATPAIEKWKLEKISKL